MASDSNPINLFEHNYDHIHFIQSLYTNFQLQINKMKKMKHRNSIQARRSGDHGIPTLEIAFAVLLSLRNMKYFILQITTSGENSFSLAADFYREIRKKKGI